MRLDHIEVFVPDRFKAAEWYGNVLGFSIIEEYRDWADNQDGPLMISNDGGKTAVALFEGTAQGDHAVRGLRRLAYREDAAGFIAFLENSKYWRGKPLSAADIKDYGSALSVYFSDPWGNLLEVTTYDVDKVRQRL